MKCPIYHLHGTLDLSCGLGILIMVYSSWLALCLLLKLANNQTLDSLLWQQIPSNWRTTIIHKAKGLVVFPKIILQWTQWFSSLYTLFKSMKAEMHNCIDYSYSLNIHHLIPLRPYFHSWDLLAQKITVAIDSKIYSFVNM